MKTLKLIISTISLTFLVACAQMNPTIVSESEVNKKDHAALVKYYENFAIKKKPQKARCYKFFQIKDKTYLRHKQNNQSHT